MPFYGLCNRLDVTSTHQSSDSRAWCLRTSDLGFTRRPVTHAPACAGHDEIHVDAGLPLPEGTDPKWRCGWAPQSPATSQSVLPWWGCLRWRRQETRACLFGNARAGRVGRW